MSNFIVSRQVYDQGTSYNKRERLTDSYKFKLYKPFVKSNKIGKKMVFKEFYLWKNNTDSPTIHNNPFIYVESTPAYPTFHLHGISTDVKGPIANKLGQDPVALVISPDLVKEGGVESFEMNIVNPGGETIPTWIPEVGYFDRSYCFRIVIDYYY